MFLTIYGVKKSQCDRSTCKEWSSNFQISKLLENPKACSFSKQVTLFWNENINPISTDLFYLVLALGGGDLLHARP